MLAIKMIADDCRATPGVRRPAGGRPIGFRGWPQPVKLANNSCLGGSPRTKSSKTLRASACVIPDSDIEVLISGRCFRRIAVQLRCRRQLGPPEALGGSA